MLNNPYQIRRIDVADAAIVAIHRSLMFRDMGLLDVSETQRLRETSLPWIEETLRQGTYVGWFVRCNEVIVGGGGVHLSTFGPKPGFIEGGKSAHTANVFVDPAHRRCGLAKKLMEGMLKWAESENVDELTLSASDEARPLYYQLGFAQDTARHVLHKSSRSDR